MKAIRHVILDNATGGEHSACGMAYDSFASGDNDSDDDYVEARPGLIVTCPACCEVIRMTRKSIRGLILKPRD